VNASELQALCARLRVAKGMLHKADIALAHRSLGDMDSPCRNGDDCAALPDGDGFSLFAIEGLLDEFVRLEPWFAGYCGVMVNLSDVAAMGGRATAVVDALWATDPDRARAILAGMRAAAAAYGVPIVGGHTNVRSAADQLAVAVFGRAKRLLTSFDARPGDVLVAAIDLRGAYFEPYAYWNCSTSAPPERLRADLALLPSLANDGLCAAAKDISMGGVLGTLLMLLECSGIGALAQLDRLPKPHGVELERWLTSFPSYGFLLAVPAERVAEVCARFRARDIACEAFGTCTARGALRVALGDAEEVFWDLDTTPFTAARARAVSSLAERAHALS
jgi:AIR synthase-related protein